MKNKQYILLIVMALLISYSCVNDSEDDLIDNTPLPPADLVNFDDNIQPIMTNNCIFCHSNPPVNGATTPLVTYNDVVTGVENNNLIARIQAQPGESGAMPLGGPRLPQNLIDLIVLWESEGFLESN